MRAKLAASEKKSEELERKASAAEGRVADLVEEVEKLKLQCQALKTRAEQTDMAAEAKVQEAKTLYEKLSEAENLLQAFKAKAQAAGTGTASLHTSFQA